MKTRTYLFAVATALAGMLAVSASTLAARPPGAGNGGGGSGAPPVDYGDLIKLYRNDNGVPYLTSDSCVQPLPSATCATDAPDCGLVASVPISVSVIPVDPATCAVLSACAACTQEVDFGRINDARSPPEVFESQLEDAVVTLATADCVTLDPAGRLVASNVDDTTLDNLAKTIDSPLQNLAIYREMVLNGFIGASPGLPLPGGNYLNTAARGLGAASDKSGGVDVDLVAYLNQIMGLSDPLTLTTLDPKICIERKQEVQGVVQLVQECFLDYSGYAYERLENFAVLPNPKYIPESGPTDGWFEYLTVLDASVPSFTIDYGPITTAVFADAAGFTGGNIGGFAQAADDARAVIDFMHTNQVPVDFETPVPCLASGTISYDVLIPEQSGLQVPVNYINTKEREFTVTVANNGPDTANFTVTVVAANGATLGSWSWSYTDVPAGQSRSVTQLFTITTTSPTIEWTATVVADGPGTDPNPGNNERTATSTVKATGGGGRP